MRAVALEETKVEQGEQLSEAQAEVRELGAELLKGSVVDLTRSKKHSALLKLLPEQRLDRADLELVEEIEQLLDQELGADDMNFIHIGRSRLELVSKEEANLFRAERREEHDAKPTQETKRELEPGLENCVLLGGLSNPKLFDGIREQLGLPEQQVLFQHFASGESQVVVNESVRGRRVFVCQTISDPINDHVMESLLEIDALKRASAEEINVVLPLYGYARQDRKGEERAPISAALLAKLYKSAGADRIITVDLHSSQTEGYFDGPLDNMYGYTKIFPKLRDLVQDEQIMVVGADQGQVKRLDPIMDDICDFFGTTDIPQGHMSKTRSGPNKVADMKFIGNPADVEGRTILLWDDMADTCGTILTAGKILRELGAARIIVAVTHPIFSHDAVEKLRSTTFKVAAGHEQRVIDKFVVTDSVPLRRAKGDLLEVASVEDLLSESIKRICQGQGASVRELRYFDGKTVH